MVALSNGGCWVCERKPQSHFSLHIDHCHKTKKVRGLLCQRCNQALGLMKDNGILLKKLAEYANA
jgi:hypothetical protein